LEAAKEDACLRKEMMDCFRESTSTTAKAIEQMSQTMKGLSEGIVQGMALLRTLFEHKEEVFQC